MTSGTEHPRARLMSRTTVAFVVAILAVALVVMGVRTSRADGAAMSVPPVPSASEAAASEAAEAEAASATPSGPLVGPTRPVYTFVSAPDLVNADFGDLNNYPGWQPGSPNSWNKTSDDSLNRLFREMASWQPDGVFVAGDEVRGHWDTDNAGTGTFGPVGTPAEKREAIRRAGDFYYQTWKDRFPANGIDYADVYPAIGDHEIGDNPWPAGSFAHDAVPDFKRVWADNFTTAGGDARRFPDHPVGTRYDDTAYATYLSPELLLVSVDTFAWSEESLDIDVRGGQLEWLRGVLAAAAPDTKIMVQGHVPVLTPVRERGSSGLLLEGEAQSAFWQLLEEYDVDLYLAGEVHNFTASQETAQGTVQLAHGGLFAHGTAGYVVGRVYADGRISLEARKMMDQATGADAERGLWQTRNEIQAKVRFGDTSESVGTLVIEDDGTISSRSGELEEYTPLPGEAPATSTEE